ncbi:MAG TPA: hypothetical protein DCR04_03395 [Flavobacteriales bacterium]|nr:hypothetical protein [Flavobacteriales bacterium]
MQPRTYYLANFTILFILSLGYFWLLVGAYYAFPNSEDLVLALDPRDEGIINSVMILLKTYDGRYFTNIMHGLNPLAFNWIEGHRLMPLFAIVFCVGAFYYFLRTFFNAWLSKLEAMILSAAVYLLHFWTVPSLVHELYWMVSSFVYLYPIPFVFIWTASAYHYLFTFTIGGWKKLTAFVASALSLWAAIGLNEMFLSVNLLLIGSGCYYLFRTDREKLKEFAPLAIIGIVSIIFFVSCPGPWSRMNENSPGGGALFVFQRLTRDIYSVLWDSSAVSWTTLIFVLGVTSWYAVLRKEDAPEVDNKKLFLWCMGLLMLGTSTLLPYYAVMNEGYVPYRVYGSFVFVLHAIMIMLAVSKLSRYFKNKTQPVSLLKYAVGALAALLLCIDLFVSQEEGFPYKNNIALIREQYTSGVLQQFELEMNARYSALNASSHLPRDKRIIVLETLSKIPDPVYHIPDIYPAGEDDAWNGYWEDYFKVNEIIVTPPRDSLRTNN